MATACPPTVTSLSTDQQAEILARLRLNKYIPQFPTPKQAYALLLPHLEVFFGGSAGPGKSSWLLMSALQYVDIPGYAAVLFRRTFAELSKPEALMERAHEWLRGTDAHWDGMRHTYRFPSGAQLVFSHLEHEASKYEHQSAAYTLVGFDEASSFTETMYRYLFSRLRRLEGFPVPLRMRAASNPGNVGHGWLKQRFMVESDPSRAFVPARAVDNPYLDIEAYALSLAQLDPLTRRRLQDGDWDISEEGTLFQRDWFRLVGNWPQVAPTVRIWDFAATEEPSRSGRERSTDPDYTVGLRMSEYSGQYWVTDMQRARLSPGRVEALVAQTAALDGRTVQVWIKQEPGSSGAAVVEDYQRRVLKGYAVQALRDTGPKLERMKPASSAAEAGNIFLVEGPWVKDFLDEVPLVGNPGVHDDIADCLATGVYVLSYGTKRAGTWGR
jgi:predicted phage terminase large subunit-like protein